MNRIRISILSIFISVGTISSVATSTVKLNSATKVNTLQAGAYYHTPEGVTFAGINKNGEFAGDYAYAPINKWLQTDAEVSPSSATFLWTYPISKLASGLEKMGESKAESFQFKINDIGLYSSPVLTSTSGTQKYSYSLASDGIYYGEYGTWDHFAVNYQPGQTTMFDQGHDFLSTNDASATAILNMIMNDGIFTDIKVYGFGESFYYCGDFYLQAINAEVYSPDQLTVDDIAVKVFKREQTSVSYTDEIAQLKTTEVLPMGDNRYFVTFKCDEPTYITTAMQVVILPQEGKLTKFSPIVPLQRYYRPSNMGTASLYATFKFTGRPASKQCLDFFGGEVTDDNNKVTGYLNNWAIGVKGSYTKPDAGIGNISADATPDPEAPVYTLTGIKVATRNTIESLPAGIYVCQGEKILKR